MEKPVKFLLPPPNFDRNLNGLVGKAKPHFLTPSGMTLLPREKQPPPMYGPRGTTVPAKFLRQQKQQPYQHGCCPPLLSTERQFCETCELEYATKEDLQRHRAQHEQCPVDGCSYRGHPSVMDKHVTALHASGLFEKFRKLSTPEEIAAWREERRKRYPTVANVEMRQRAHEQRQKRGERIEAKRSRFGKREDRRRVQFNASETPVSKNEGVANARIPDTPSNRGRKRGKKQKNQRKTQEKPETRNIEELAGEKLKCCEEEEDITCCGVRMFRGTSGLKDYKHAKAKKEKVTNALMSLLSMYGSDDDDEEESNMEEEKTKIISIDQQFELRPVNDFVEDVLSGCWHTEHRNGEENSVSKLVEINIVPKVIETATQKFPYQSDTVEADSNRVVSICSSDEPPEEAPIARSSNLPVFEIREVVSLPRANNEPSNKHRKSDTLKPYKITRKKSGLNYRKANLGKQNTMLAKLLEGDIRHERNVLLQCVRFVCENNFFGVDGEQKPLQ